MQQKQLYASVIDKKFTTSSDSVVINIIPQNDCFIYIPIEDKIDFNQFTQEEKNTMKVTLYYNTDLPIDYSIDFGSIEIVYFMQNFLYPESQKLIIRKI